ncbi:MAG TPA: hypothetical protein VFA59_11320 [Vicinamibacterales bacterium]|nr:hypothetical protein [Vicinamibacterales bacterium]
MAKTMDAQTFAAEGKQFQEAGDKESAAGNTNAADTAYSKAADAYAAAVSRTTDTDKANKWLAAETKALKAMSTTALTAYGDSLAKQAETMETHAKNAPRQEGPGGATEIYPKAARMRGRAGWVYQLLAFRVAAPVPSAALQSADFSMSVGYQYSQEASDFERAADGEPLSEGDEKDGLLRAASEIRNDAASAFARAADVYSRFNQPGDASSAQTKATSEREASYSDLLSIASDVR